MQLDKQWFHGAADVFFPNTLRFEALPSIISFCSDPLLFDISALELN
jgi:hypothetical protein